MNYCKEDFWNSKSYCHNAVNAYQGNSSVGIISYLKSIDSNIINDFFSPAVVTFIKQNILKQDIGFVLERIYTTFIEQLHKDLQQVKEFEQQIKSELYSYFQHLAQMLSTGHIDNPESYISKLNTFYSKFPAHHVYKEDFCKKELSKSLLAYLTEENNLLSQKYTSIIPKTYEEFISQIYFNKADGSFYINLRQKFIKLFDQNEIKTMQHISLFLNENMDINENIDQNIKEELGKKLQNHKDIASFKIYEAIINKAHSANLIIKAADTALDTIKLFSEPNGENILQVGIGCIQLWAMHHADYNVILATTAVTAGKTLYQAYDGSIGHTILLIAVTAGITLGSAAVYAHAPILSAGLTVGFTAYSGYTTFKKGYEVYNDLQMPELCESAFNSMHSVIHDYL